MDALIPSAADKEKREQRNLTAVGLLAPGVSQKSASAEMETITHNLQTAYPATNKGISGVVHTFTEEFNGPELTSLFLALMGAVAFVLLIACANVANLLLARAVGRTRDISIRVALAAGRWRVIRQLLVESLMLSITGGVLGWLISKWGIRAFDAAVAGQKPAFMDFSMDYLTLGYAALFLAALFLPAARVLFGITMIVYGIDHFQVLRFIATLIPSWIPFRLFWSAFTGVAFIAAGVCIIAKWQLRLASFFLGLMFFLWVLVVHASRIAASVHNQDEWNSGLIALAICGSAWILAE